MTFAKSTMKRCGIVRHAQSGSAIGVGHQIKSVCVLSVNKKGWCALGVLVSHANVTRCQMKVSRSRDQYKRWLAKRVRNAKRRKALGKTRSMESMFEALAKRLAARLARRGVSHAVR